MKCEIRASYPLTLCVEQDEKRGKTKAWQYSIEYRVGLEEKVIGNKIEFIVATELCVTACVVSILSCFLSTTQVLDMWFR